MTIIAGALISLLFAAILFGTEETRRIAWNIIIVAVGLTVAAAAAFVYLVATK